MNQQQKRYALARLAEIQNEKFVQLHDAIDKAARRRHSRLGGRTRAEAEALVQKAFRGNKQVKLADYLSEHSLAGAFEWSSTETEAQRSKRIAKMDAAKKRLQVEYNRVRDELMLGDAEEALQMLKDFQELDIVGGLQ